MLKKLILLSLVMLACTKKENTEVAPQTSNAMDEMQVAKIKEPAVMDIVPGKSLGDAKLGDTMMDLMDKGFDHDRSFSDPENHVMRNDVHILLKKDIAVEISFDGHGDHTKLKFEGQEAPRSKAEVFMREYFKKCDKSAKTSKGFTIFCQNKGIRIDYGPEGEYLDFSVIGK